jgi:hypothetical protein
VGDRILDGSPHQVLGSGRENGLDPNARVRVDLVTEITEKIDQLLGSIRSLLKLDTSVDVLCIFSKYHHVEKIGSLDGSRNAGEVSDWTDTSVEVKDLDAR